MDWAERRIGKSYGSGLRQAAWLDVFRKMRTISIDTPDYSKTDRRQMTKDLEEIYWLWDQLAFGLSDRKPNLLVAIQKEMFRDHFFFDKMQKIELEPVKPTQMVPE